MNPGKAIFRGSFVYARIRKGLRASRLWAASGESDGANAESPTPTLNCPRRAEGSLFLSLTDPIQLALRVALVIDGNPHRATILNWLGVAVALGDM